MKRRSLAAISLVSALFLCAVVASWIRSYWVYDQVAFGAFAHGRWAWSAYSASYPFARWPPAVPQGASHTLLTCFGKIYFHGTVYHGDSQRGVAAPGRTWASDDNILPSFSYLYAVTSDMSGKGWWTIRQVTTRHWALAVLFALLPLAWLRASQRRTWRRIT